MGNTSAKHYENMQQRNDYSKIDLSNLDPYQVLDVPRNFTWDQLKDAYRQAALKTHPDKKGGNKLVFDFVTTCFKTLAEEYKAKHSNKSHQDLKREASEYYERMPQMPQQQSSRQAGPLQADPNEPFEKRFNNAFDQCKYVDEDIQFGYGDMMLKSDKNRDDIAIENVFGNNSKVSNETFNDVFKKKVPVNKGQVIKYKPPEPVLLAKQLKFTEIDNKRPDDYSSRVDNSGLVYTDYMKAHSNQRQVDPDNDPRVKKTFRSAEEYQKYSNSKMKKGLSERERRFLEEQKRKEEEEEFLRLERVKKRDQAMQLAFQKANQMLLS